MLSPCCSLGWKSFQILDVIILLTTKMNLRLRIELNSAWKWKWNLLRLIYWCWNWFWIISLDSGENIVQKVSLLSQSLSLTKLIKYWCTLKDGHHWHHYFKRCGMKMKSINYHVYEKLSKKNIIIMREQPNKVTVEYEYTTPNITSSINPVLLEHTSHYIIAKCDWYNDDLW